jgi:alkylation response protein AidB-like acyl-CoA dehydrogenase
MVTTDRERQIRDAEEMFGDWLAKVGFAKGFYYGEYQEAKLPPYPRLDDDPEVNQAVHDLRQFAVEKIDPVRIDREAEIPQNVIEGLGRLGVLGACLPKSCGGRGFSQTAYCRLIEVLGAHCGGTALFVNAHHSIGPRAIVLFGTPDQQARWLPKLATGEWLSAFALTEPEAGSDAANVQTQAVPTEDGRGFRLTGEKRWITNGGIAQVLTVMARTPVPGERDTKITAFMVTPDMPGFEVVEKRMAKCGVRGSATARLVFHDMFVPKENILGALGKGLRVALTVLDYGRTTFGASCTGAAKFCVENAARHAARRVQFGRPLASFELVQSKLARMAAATFAMESATFQTAALIDSGADDYMLETAMLKVFSTEHLWHIVNETIQVFGGKAYFNDEPYERMMRDARIALIGEGANDVLRVFIAMVGIRDVGLELKGVLDALLNPFGNLGRIGAFAGRRIDGLLRGPSVHVHSAELADDAQLLDKAVARFGSQVERLCRTLREELIDRQLVTARVGDSATELYVWACVLRRLDRMLVDGALEEDQLRRQLELGRYAMLLSRRRIAQWEREMWDHDDEKTARIGEAVAKGKS